MVERKGLCAQPAGEVEQDHVANDPEQRVDDCGFKSDRDKLPDGELVQAAVCLANTQGGTIYVGVEDDGEATGLHPAHRAGIDGLAALIANRTVPPLSVRVRAVEVEGVVVVEVEVPRSKRLVATTSGTLQRRRLRVDGTPECVPFLPHEFPAHQADLGLLDYSALPVRGATPDDLDPVERQRLRRAIERYRGDPNLVELADSDTRPTTSGKPASTRCSKSRWCARSCASMARSGAGTSSTCAASAPVRPSGCSRG